jgi:hypothetical protein
MRIAVLLLIALIGLLGATSARAQQPADDVTLARAVVIRLADRIGATFIVRGEGALTDAVRSAVGDRLAAADASPLCPPGYPAGHGGTWAITVRARHIDADSAIAEVDYHCRLGIVNGRARGFGMTEDVVFRRGASGLIFVRRDMTRIT